MFDWLRRRLRPRAGAPDWRGDWLYALALRRADDAWRSRCDRAPKRDMWRYVLVGEWSRGGGGMCGGELVRAWVRDDAGLREISRAEYRRRQRGASLPGSHFLRCVLVQFHIRSDRTRVILGQREATLSGHGGEYLVVGEGADAELVPDPEGGRWVS